MSSNDKELFSSGEFRKKLFERINAISSAFNVNYPINPRIRYEYPEINEITIQNIVNALIACPKFYIQTLHLMNKMNLPCPLVSFVRTARPPLPNPTATNQHILETTESSSESEIEIENDTEATLKRISAEEINKSMPKRLKLQTFLKSNAAVVEASKNKIELENVFEKPVELKEENRTRSAANPSEYDRQIIESNKDSFGKIIPIDKQPSEVINEQEAKNETDSSEFITQNELEKNRLKIAELKELPVYKNYDKGESSSRLYLKNLAKSVQESDLKRIYGRYVDWNDEQNVNAFDIRLMKEGRMKGQAFITYSSEQVAENALSETNGYVLFDKPIIVSFAKSAKPK